MANILKYAEKSQILTKFFAQMIYTKLLSIFTTLTFLSTFSLKIAIFLPFFKLEFAFSLIYY